MLIFLPLYQYGLIGDEAPPASKGSSSTVFKMGGAAAASGAAEPPVNGDLHEEVAKQIKKVRISPYLDKRRVLFWGVCVFCIIVVGL
jgi:hypothetical protein